MTDDIDDIVVVRPQDVECNPGEPPCARPDCEGLDEHTERAHKYRPLGSAWRAAVLKARARIERERQE